MRYFICFAIVCSIVTSLVFSLSSCTILHRQFSHLEDMDEDSYQLLLAIKNNNREGVKEALNAGIDLNEIDYGGSFFASGDKSAIGYALECVEEYINKDTSILKQLVKHGANVNGCDCKYRYPYIVYLAGIRNRELLDLFIDHGASVNVEGSFPSNVTPLTALLSDEWLNYFTYKVERGSIYTNKRDIADYEYMITLLLNNGAKAKKSDLKKSLNSMGRLTSAPILVDALIKQQQKTGLSIPLESIILSDSKTALSNIDKVKKKEKQNMILFASAYGDKQLLKRMVELGYDFDVELKLDDGLVTPLEIAASFNDIDALVYLCNIIDDPYKTIEYSSIIEEPHSILTSAIMAESDNVKWLSDHIQFAMGKTVKNDNVSDFVKAVESSNFTVLTKMSELSIQPSAQELKNAYVSLVKKGDKADLIRFHELGYKMPIGDEEDFSLTELLNEDNEECILQVIDWGATVSSYAIEEATQCGNCSLLHTMLIKYKGKLDKEMLLTTAIEQGDILVLKELISKGLSVEMPTWISENEKVPTMIHYAAICPSVNTIKYLLSVCDDPEKIKQMKDSQNATPYEIAKRVKLKKNMRVLI